MRLCHAMCRFCLFFTESRTPEIYTSRHTLSLPDAIPVLFICLAGLAVLNGLVVMTAIRDRSEAGLPIAQAIREGMAEKMRAVIMTGFVPAIGFVQIGRAHV